MVGDVAPGLCLDNGLVAVNVIPGLCNGERPLEHFVGHPRYVAILDADKKERYWVQTYPQTVAGSHLLKQERVLKWIVGIYAVDSSAKG